jgi:hypothetical protein
MAIVSGNFDGGQSIDNIDLTHAKTLECEECGCKGFKQSLMLKELSPLVSPNGKEAIVPISIFCCEQCGHINKKFQDAEVTGA